MSVVRSLQKGTVSDADHQSHRRGQGATTLHDAARAITAGPGQHTAWLAPRRQRHPASALTALLRLDKPGPGVAARGAFDIGGQSMIVRTAYHFGDQPAETVVRETPPWQGWIRERFPVPSRRARAHDLRTRGGKKRGARKVRRLPRCRTRVPRIPAKPVASRRGPLVSYSAVTHAG
jgi:hypothetical protein